MEKKILPFNHWRRRFQRWKGGSFTPHGDECVLCYNKEGKTMDGHGNIFCDDCAPKSGSYTYLMTRTSRLSYPSQLPKKYIARGLASFLLGIPILWILYQEVIGILTWHKEGWDQFINNFSWAALVVGVTLLFGVVVGGIFVIWLLFQLGNWIGDNWN